MDRRRFLLTSLAGVLTAPLAAGAQQAGRVYRVGVLVTASRPDGQAFLGNTFGQGMRDLGYVEGRNLVLEVRFAEGHLERLPSLAQELDKAEPEHRRDKGRCHNARSRPFSPTETEARIGVRPLRGRGADRTHHNQGLNITRNFGPAGRASGRWSGPVVADRGSLDTPQGERPSGAPGVSLARAEDSNYRAAADLTSNLRARFSATFRILRFPMLIDTDVYATIAYYLRHTAEVDEYLRKREIEAEEIRREIQARFPTAGLRERLLARAAKLRAP